MKEIEEAFRTTTRLLFGEELAEIKDYEKWLERRIPRIKIKKDIDNKEIPLPEYKFFKMISEDKIISNVEQANKNEEKVINMLDAHKIEGIRKWAGKNFYFLPNFEIGRNINVESSTMYINSINLYKTIDLFDCKNCGYSFSGIYSESCFGCYRFISNRFSIHVYNSENISLGFEVDSSKNCSNVFFSYNLENSNECIFCFNAKNLSYAIANKKLPRDEYFKAKEKIMKWILSELKKKKWLERDILNILSKN